MKDSGYQHKDECTIHILAFGIVLVLFEGDVAELKDGATDITVMMLIAFTQCYSPSTALACDST